MKIGFKVLENTALPRFEAMPEAIQSEMAKSFTSIGGRIVETARGIVPVRTGALRASISYDVRATTVVVGANTPYAGFVEYGTRFQRPKPYLRPALQANLSYVEGKLRDAVVAAMLR